LNHTHRSRFDLNLGLLIRGNCSYCPYFIGIGLFFFKKNKQTNKQTNKPIFIEIVQPYNDCPFFFYDLVNNNSFIISKNDHGSAYLPPWGFTHSIDNNEGYQVKLSTSDTLIQCGLQISPESHPITLEQGWNIMPYLRDTAQEIAEHEVIELAGFGDSLEKMSDAVEALSTISSEIHLVKNILGQVYMPSWDYNGIGNLEPGKGYQIKMNSEQILIYDAND